MKKQQHTVLGLVIIAVIGIGMLPFQMHLCQFPHQMPTADACPMQETATSGGCCSRTMNTVTCSMTPVVGDTEGQEHTTMACQCSIVAVATSTDVFLPKLDSKISLDLPMQSSEVVSERGISSDDQYAFASTLNLVPCSASPPLFLLNSNFLI